MRTASDRLLETKDKLIRLLTFLVVLLGALVIHAHSKVIRMPEEWVFYAPPNLDAGGAVRVGNVPGVEAFNFAFTMWANVNTWLQDGGAEYPLKLDQYRLYFSPKFIAQKKQVAARDALSLKNRRRVMEWVNKSYFAKQIAVNEYEISFDVRVVDQLGDVVVIDEVRRYFFLVAPFKVPKQQNPWQMRVEAELRDYEVVKKNV